MSKARICGTITGDLTCVALESQKEKRIRWNWKNNEIMAASFQTLAKDINLQIPKKRNNSLPTGEAQLEWMYIFHHKLRKPEGIGTFCECESKELSTQNPISSENILRNKKKIKTVSAEEKLREFVVSRPILKEWLKETV